MDSRLIEVAIGLALTFAMLSLLATAVMEGLASIRNHRGATLEKLVISVMGNDGDLARRFFNHPLMQSLVQGRRRPSYVPPDVFTTTMLNVLSDGLAVKPRTGTPADFIDAVKSSALGKRPQTKALFDTLDVLLQGVEHDWGGFEAALRRWFEQAGDRSSGWYKRGNTIWLFIIGVILAVGLNIDSLRIATALWNDPVLRQRTVTQTQVFLDDYEKKRSAAQTAPKPEHIAADCKDDDVSEFCKIARALGQMQSTGIPMGWSGPFPTPHVNAASGDSKDYLFALNLFAMVMGWLITAVAVTLGAPFWFDTLSKLIKLRGSGAKAETEAQKPSAPIASPAATAGGAAGAAAVAADGESRSPDESKLSAGEIEVIQQRLGLPNSQVTGRLDPTTRTFIGRWQETQGWQRTSLLTAQQINLLLTQGPIPPRSA